MPDQPRTPPQKELRLRRRQDRRAADASLVDAALRRIDGTRRLEDVHVDVGTPGGGVLRRAVEELGRRQGFVVPETTARTAGDRSEDVDDLAAAAGVRTRVVQLRPGWHRRDGGPLLGYLDTRERGSQTRPVALLPARRGRSYELFDPADASRRRVDDDTAAAIGLGAVQFFPALSATGDLTFGMVARFAFAGARRDLGLVVALAAAVAVLGLVMPIAINHVFGSLTVGRQQGILVGSGLGLLAAAVVSGALALAQGYAVTRVGLKAEQRLQPAVWDRVLRLPVSFFRDFRATGLVTRILGVDGLNRSLSAGSIGVVLGAVFSLVNLVLMFHYEPTLGAAGALILALIALGTIWIGRELVEIAAQIITQDRDNGAHLTSILEGLSIIREAAAEARFFALHVELVARMIVLQARMRRTTIRLQAFYGLMAAAAPVAFFAIIGLNWTTEGSAVSAATYFAFSTAFGAILSAIISLTTLVQPLAVARPTLSAMQPIFRAEPEYHHRRRDPGRLDGRMALQNVSFRYRGSSGPVLRDVSLSVDSGEFVAVVGRSGSGKSTLVRLLLGFEQPDEGTVVHGDHDLASVDVAAVRSQLGVVLQDTRPMGGSIADNVRGARRSPLAAVWEALAEAGLADDVRAMPMGVHTIVDPAGSTFSGGQLQRLAIARALLGSPTALILDEATSSLDDLTQGAVSDNIDRLQMTRLVIAHRLSTIRRADRIVVLDNGRLTQEGTFEALSRREGPFRDLIARQVV